MEWLADFWATYSTLAYSVGVNGLLALSIWLTLACGLLSLANAAFMGIGAYTAALLTVAAGWPYPTALAAGALAPAAAALAIGEVTRIFILNLEITGGPEGLNGIPLLTDGWQIAAILAVVIYGLA